MNSLGWSSPRLCVLCGRNQLPADLPQSHLPDTHEDSFPPCSHTPPLPFTLSSQNTKLTLKIHREGLSFEDQIQGTGIKVFLETLYLSYNEIRVTWT